MAHNPILNSTIKGEGVPLLILHGYFGMSDNWKTLGNQFSENFQVHLIDQRNHGRSGRFVFLYTKSSIRKCSYNWAFYGR
jgi:pimeloyl-ACP methyl ester carboxylesterase